ncbi:uncharacterized protein [Dermacentor albipictus]|uniref:uncharacterized protein isoform X2 n=1 Tax=Dermacentor albipictus TaxID=60249 RepID=UPI0038FC3782
MDGVDSQLPSQPVGSHSTTPNALSSPGGSSRGHQRSKQGATPPGAAEEAPLKLTPPGAPDSTRSPDSTSPNSTTGLYVNKKRTHKHDGLRHKKHGRAQSPHNRDRPTGTAQGTKHEKTAVQKDVVDMGSPQDKPTPQSNTIHNREKMEDVGVSECKLNKTGKSDKVTEIRCRSDMCRAEDSKTTASRLARRRKSATFADFGPSVAKTPALCSGSSVCMSPADEMATNVPGAASQSPAGLSEPRPPLCSGSRSSPHEQSPTRQRRKKSGRHGSMGNVSPPFRGSGTPPRHKRPRPSETESKGAGTLADHGWQWRSNPLLALIHRASQYRTKSISTASVAESVQKSAAYGMDTVEGTDAITTNLPEGIGASVAPLAGGRRNAADMGRAMPFRSFRRHANFAMPPDEATSISEKHGFSSGFSKLLQRASSGSLYVCLVCLILVLISAVVLLASFLTTRRDTKLGSYEGPHADAFRRFCDNEACRSAIDRLMLSTDPYVNPCDDFYRYVCGRWEESRSEGHKGFSYAKENFVNHTLMLHRALDELAKSPALLDHEEHNMALFYHNCHDFARPRQGGQTTEPTIEAVLLEMGINESSTHVATFQDVFALALAESVATSLPSLVSATVTTSSASGHADVSIGVGATLASTLPQGYVEGFLDDTFARWHSEDQRRVALMGKVDETLDKLRAPCNASDGSFVMIKDLKAPFPGGDWLEALKSLRGEKTEPVYTPESNVTIRGETCIGAMLSYLRRVSVADARIYSLAVMYAHVKNYAYVARRQSYNPTERASNCLRFTASLFSKPYLVWLKTKVVSEESIRAFNVMMERLEEAARNLPSLADRLNVTTPGYEPIRLDAIATGEEDAQTTNHHAQISIGSSHRDTFLHNVIKAQKATAQGTRSTDNSYNAKRGEGGGGASLQTKEVFDELFLTPDLFLPQVSEPALYYGSSGVLLLLQRTRASVEQDIVLREAIQLHHRCLHDAASFALGRSATEEEVLLVPVAIWALKVAHWAAVLHRPPVQEALAPSPAKVDQEAKWRTNTRSRLFFHRFCATSCGDERAARACKIGAHLSREFSEAFNCRAPRKYWCQGDND